jgi:UDP-N-acetylmuramoyl-L-alanyl-D-glutamate--2,6-diaminopimelate ligase
LGAPYFVAHLDQRRADGCKFQVAIITNLTRDHLDYHGDAECYLAAKLRLSALLGPAGFEIVNADDRAWDALPSFPRRVTFGESPEATVRAEGSSSRRAEQPASRGDLGAPTCGSR